MPSSLVVVLNWNGLSETTVCVEALLQQSADNFHILVVDNGSREKPSKDTAPFNNPLVSLMFNEYNRGFAGGVNDGIRHGIQEGFDTIVLLNNDAVVDKDWLAEIIKPLKDESTYISCGLLLDENGASIDSAGEKISIWGMSFPEARGLPRDKSPKSGYTFGSTGGAVAYKTSLFKKIGLFDETFFAYFEDADINFRTQLAGLKAYYTDRAVAYHKKGVTSAKIPGFTIYQLFKNLPLLFWKNIPTKLLARVGLRFLVLYTLMFGKAIKNGSGWPALKGVLASIYYFWISALWKRIKIQSTKKVSADYIWSILYHDLPPEQTGMRKFRKVFTGKD